MWTTPPIGLCCHCHLIVSAVQQIGALTSIDSYRSSTVPSVEPEPSPAARHSPVEPDSSLSSDKIYDKPF